LVQIELRYSVLDLGERGAKGCCEASAFRRQFHAPSEAVEQRDAELRLEQLHLLRHSRNRNESRERSASKTLVRRGVEEGLEEFEADHVGLTSYQEVIDCRGSRHAVA
jgi:hypothetical protein